MAYDEKTWVNGDVITAEDMNNIENGIAENDDGIALLLEYIADLDGLSDEVKEALLDCFQHVAWTDDQGQTYYDALEHALYPIDLVSISAVFDSQGTTIYTDDTLDSLKQYLTVTANYSDSSTVVVTDYTLSGSLTEGTSTITVSYNGKTTTFNVTAVGLVSISAVFDAQGTTIYTDDSLDSLKQYLTVTANYSDSTSEVVTSYTLSGTLVAGTSTITVSYGEMTTSFTISDVIDFYEIRNWSTQDGLSVAMCKGVGQKTTPKGTSMTYGGATANRCSFWTGHGKLTVYDETPETQGWTDDYPIPIPTGATSVVATISNYASSYVAFSVWRYDTQTGLYTRLVNGGWITSGSSFSLNNSGENIFLSINSKADQAGTALFTVDPVISVEFTV